MLFSSVKPQRTFSYRDTACIAMDLTVLYQYSCTPPFPLPHLAPQTHPGGAVSERRGRRVALPDSFLRVPGWGAGGEVSSDPQVAADARLAMMLQVRVVSYTMTPSGNL